jgi:hypothetical protein
VLSNSGENTTEWRRWGSEDSVSRGMSKIFNGGFEDYCAKWARSVKGQCARYARSH